MAKTAFLESLGRWMPFNPLKTSFMTFTQLLKVLNLVDKHLNRGKS